MWVRTALMWLRCARVQEDAQNSISIGICTILYVHSPFRCPKTCTHTGMMHSQCTFVAAALTVPTHRRH